ncbi:MAG: C39 family peptidase [Victivallales bacterium]
MSNEIFSPWNQPQENYANCGPTGLSYCLFTLFGNEIDQDDVASSLYSGPKKWYKTTSGGFNQDELRKAAGKFKAKAEFLQVCGEDNFEKFNRRLVVHLKTGNPVLFCINDGDHWVSILGYDEKQGKPMYYVNDPDQRGVDEVCDVWSKAGVKEEFIGEDEEYFAILLSRRDGKAPSLPLSKSLVALVNEGSYDNMAGMLEDLRAMAKKASDNDRENSYLADHLFVNRNTILKVLKDLLDWDNTESDFDEVSAFYDDYITVVRASRIKMSKDADLVLLTAYMTSLLTTCAWMGEL